MTMPSAKPLGLNNICNDNKKASKPLIEKRRRARINFSLAELKGIVVGTDKTTQSTTTRPPKLEKADILEMTVAFVKKLQAKQDTSPRLINYSSGFELCLKEVCQFLEEEGCLNLKTRLMMHLQSVQPLSNASETSNTPTDDSMSCSSRSQTPSTVGMDQSQMEYSSCSPFTDTEQEVPSTSKTLLDRRTFATTERSELGMDCRNPMERLTPEYPSPSSYQDVMPGVVNGPLNLAITPKKDQKDDVADQSQVLQSQWHAVNYRTRNNFSPRVVTYNCGHVDQEPKLMEHNGHQGQLNFAFCSNCSNCVWRPW